jgi:CRISPR/Cas system-associated exonuclease Cas4 (RecB family)
MLLSRMFENLRRAFKEAVDNFKEELDRDAVPETVDRLLLQMTREATDAKAYVSRLEDESGKALKAAESERKEAATCRRREKMAADIGDEETATLARSYAEKHEGRHHVLEQKALALKKELELRRGEVAEMIEAIKNARQNRDALSAQAGRPGARDSISAADELFDRLDQMEEQLEDQDQVRKASAEVDHDVHREDDLRIRFDKFQDDQATREAVAEDRLEELKRRMGRED